MTAKKRRRNSLIGSVTALVALLLAIGCVSTTKYAPNTAMAQSIVANNSDVATQPEEDPTEPEPTSADESGGIDLTDIDGLLKSARAFCGDSLYNSADSTLRRASAFLMRNIEEADNQWLPLEDYIADIISIYAELMPPKYSMPEEISSMIFKQNMLESLLDTLKISPQDSIFLVRLSSKRKVVYDVPMVWNDRVKRALMFYMRTRKGVFDRWLHRAGFYLPTMRQMFADEGLPQDLAHLPIIESGFNTHAYSRAHAAGIWQFIPSTGRIYGLRQNYWIDERRDPLKSTVGAMSYLKKLYNDFGDWHIALASYNCGENGMARAIRKANDTRDYWALSLPKETMNYVPLYLAAVIIAKNPDVFEFAIQDSSVFDYDTVSINDCVELATIASGIEVSLDTLTTMNPHILHWCTPPDMQGVRLYLPKGYAEKFETFYKELPDEKRTKFYRYKVQNGDNMVQIARNFRVPVDALREINKMKNNSISAGKFLIVPIPVNDSVPSSLAAFLNTSDRQKPVRGGGGGAASRTGKKMTYKVRTGETLYSIANRFGVTVNNLMAWNYMSSPRNLKAEQTLVIYMKEQAPKAQTAQRAATPSLENAGKRMVRQGETLYGISQELGVSVQELARINGLDARRPLLFPGDVLVYPPRDGQSGSVGASQSVSAARPIPPVAQSTPSAPKVATGGGQVSLYTVKRGDNLWRIALNFGVTVDSIRDENNLTAGSAIMPGDILKITRSQTE